MTSCAARKIKDTGIKTWDLRPQCMLSMVGDRPSSCNLLCFFATVIAQLRWFMSVHQFLLLFAELVQVISSMFWPQSTNQDSWRLNNTCTHPPTNVTVCEYTDKLFFHSESQFREKLGPWTKRTKYLYFQFPLKCGTYLLNFLILPIRTRWTGGLFLRAANASSNTLRWVDLQYSFQLFVTQLGRGSTARLEIFKFKIFFPKLFHQIMCSRCFYSYSLDPIRTASPSSSKMEPIFVIYLDFPMFTLQTAS